MLSTGNEGAPKSLAEKADGEGGGCGQIGNRKAERFSDENLSVITEVGILQTVGALVGAEAVPGVDEGDGFAVHGQGIQLPPLDPAHGHAVVVAGGVADGVVGEC